MSGKDLARRITVVGNTLIAASLFIVLIWWWLSASLFVTGVVAHGLAWVLDGGLFAAPSTAQE